VNFSTFLGLDGTVTDGAADTVMDTGGEVTTGEDTLGEDTLGEDTLVLGDDLTTGDAGLELVVIGILAALATIFTTLFTILIGVIGLDEGVADLVGVAALTTRGAVVGLLTVALF
jgi:hypothetical protein